ncbi:N-acetyltransferase (plasmid) [Burkholderia vietnamiensis]|uniref:N-acetyltransferase domain-containing protein n=1 Tax=Burkholderia vietnamiensis (strain G4 / LMG 22486) TaxID=269482 RepID=A4JV91_BURVG|nr:hypothetical protein Bcep1808_7317 [Burkholderia vietnamiensis G4]MCB4349382.1 N-acetyltransferase [Burkholderia vietnamiensis]
MLPIPTCPTGATPYLQIATEEVITALAQLGEDPTVTNAESIRARLDVPTILVASDRAAAIRDSIRTVSRDRAPTPPPAQEGNPDLGSTLTFEDNRTGETPWRLDTHSDTIARLTAADGTTLATVWCNRSDTCLQIEYSEVRPDARRQGVYRRLLERISTHYNVYSDEAHNNAAKSAYHALGALETRSGRMLLRKQPAASLEISTPNAEL